MPSSVRADLPATALLVGSAILFYAVPGTIPSLLLLAVTAGLAWWRLDLAVYLPVLFAPAYFLPKHIGSEQFSPSEIFILLDLAVGVLWFLDRKRSLSLQWQRALRSPFLPGALLLLVAGAVSTIAAVDRHEALRAYRETVAEPVLWFGLLLTLQSSLYRCLIGLGALLATGTAMASLALAQLVTGRGTSSAVVGSVPRVLALYGSPDNLGLLLDRVVPVWFAAFLADFRDRWRWPLAVVGGILAAALLFTFSRGAWVAVVVGCLVIVLRYSWGRRLAAAAVIVALAAAGWKGPGIIRALQAGHPGTAERRVYVWKSAAHMIRDHPIVGVGPDNFVHYYAPKNDLYISKAGCSAGLGYMDPAASSEPCLSHPHNVVLDFWLSTGILGVAAFIWLMFAFWRGTIRAYRAVGARERMVLLGAAGAMVAALMHGLVDNFYFLPDLSVLFWLLCAVVSFFCFADSAVWAHTEPKV